MYLCILAFSCNCFITWFISGGIFKFRALQLDLLSRAEELMDVTTFERHQREDLAKLKAVKAENAIVSAESTDLQKRKEEADSNLAASNSRKGVRPGIDLN